MLCGMQHGERISIVANSGQLQLRCHLLYRRPGGRFGTARTRPRTDVDPPRFLDRAAIGGGGGRLLVLFNVPETAVMPRCFSLREEDLSVVVDALCCYKFHHCACELARLARAVFSCIS